MTRIKCPFCGKAGAILDPNEMKAATPTCESVTCRDPTCRCYDPVAYGYDENMSDELKSFYKVYLKARKDEADF